MFMILITVGASNGLEEGVRADLGSRVKNSAFLWTNQTTMPFKGYTRKDMSYDWPMTTSLTPCQCISLTCTLSISLGNGDQKGQSSECE